MSKSLPALMCSFLCVSLNACSNVEVKNSEPTKAIRDRRMERDGKLFGDALTVGGERRRNEGAAGGGGGIGVNAHLWHASLDSISFMPLASADPFGGVIITDWYSPSGIQYERFKVHIFILDKLLRSDAIRVSVFHQKWDAKTQQWQSSVGNPKMTMDFENVILMRARQLRIGSAN